MGMRINESRKVCLLGASRIIAPRIATQVAKSTESAWVVAWGRMSTEGYIERKTMASPARNRPTPRMTWATALASCIPRKAWRIRAKTMGR